jgi:hypothetical protein
MAREPRYPKDVPVGSAESGGKPVAALAPAAPEKAADPRRTKHLMTGAAIGIGSAAIVAALLYANRGKRGGHS